ncbi:amine oxidase [Chitinispirillum alkaliphilum]|nr:amine oxidase [Chitinispirillum alkaliphilum]
MSQTVTIIGAGIAGLAAADILSLSGMRVIVLEASDRAGGRILTDRSFTHPVELGAQWIHGHLGNPIMSLAEKMGIKTLPFKHDTILYSSPEQDTIYINQNISEYFSTYQKDASLFALREQTDISLLKAMIKTAPKFATTEQKYSYYAQVARNGLTDAADPDSISARQTGKDKYFDGEDRWFPNGYDQLISQLAKGLDIRFNQTVKGVIRNKQGIEIHTKNFVYKCNYVIVTVPLGVLKEGDIQFEPALPQKKSESIRALEMGVLNKAILCFKKKFWPDTGHFMLFPAFWDLIYKSFTGIHHDNSSLIVGWVNGKTAQAIEYLENQQLKNSMLTTLELIMGEINETPNHVAISRWSQNPLTRGSYSFVPVNANHSDYSTLAQPFGTILFAGEATSSEYPGTVHGAYLSGVREAQRIIHF